MDGKYWPRSTLFLAGSVAEPDDHGIEEEAQYGTKGIDEDIGDETSPFGDEGLVEFIAGGVEDGDRQGDPSSFRPLSSFAECKVEELEEDEVFGDVGGFADEYKGVFAQQSIQVNAIRRQGFYNEAAEAA